MSSVQFIDKKTGWVVGGLIGGFDNEPNVVLQTEDGGATWVRRQWDFGKLSPTSIQF
jgi:photosystem II stability/assembly factor-like uncharacterized protein